MSVLTRIPRELRSRLAAADPADGIEAVERPNLDELIARAESETPIRSVRVLRATRVRRLAPIAAVAAVAVVTVGIVVMRNEQHRPAGIGPAAAGSSFPVSATPRPLVTVGDTVLAGEFPSGDTELAFENGAIDLATALPAAPPDRDGYPVMPARTAVAQVTDVHSCCAGTATRLSIVAVTLVDHSFSTDRGDRRLPAWQIEFRGVAYDTYVLAVAPAARYPHQLTGFAAGAGDATISADGRKLTIWLRTTYRASTGPCDITYRQALTVGQRSDAVQLSVDTVFERAPAPNSGTYSPMACDNIGHVIHPAERPTEGAPNSRTITLDRPLGNRIVIDESGRPYVVTR